jgi:hypothetical protein
LRLAAAVAAALLFWTTSHIPALTKATSKGHQAKPLVWWNCFSANSAYWGAATLSATRSRVRLQGSRRRQKMEGVEEFWPARIRTRFSLTPID